MDGVKLKKTPIDVHISTKEMLHKASSYDILKTIAGCYIYIQAGMEVVRERLNAKEGGQYAS